jgi:hypothetical protein
LLGAQRGHELAADHLRRRLRGDVRRDRDAGTDQSGSSSAIGSLPLHVEGRAREMAGAHRGDQSGSTTCAPRATLTT